MPQLIVIKGPVPGQRFELAGKQVIGRGNQANLRIADASLSRAHCSVQTSVVGVIIEDKDSTNGIYINSKHVTQPYVLLDGDVVTLGHVNLLFSVQSGQSDSIASTDIPLPQYVEPSRDTDLIYALHSCTRQLNQQGFTTALNTHLNLLIEAIPELNRILCFTVDRENRKALKVLAMSENALLNQKYDAALLAFVIQEKLNIISPNARTDSRKPVKIAAKSLAVEQIIVLPLILDQSVQGLLYLDGQSTQARLDTIIPYLKILADTLCLSLKQHIKKNASAGRLSPEHQISPAALAWQKNLSGGNPPFSNDYIWLQSCNADNKQAFSPLHYQTRPQGEYLLALDSRHNSDAHLCQLVLLELCCKFDHWVSEKPNPSQFHSWMLHHSTGLPIQLDYALLYLDKESKRLHWVLQGLSLFFTNGYEAPDEQTTMGNSELNHGIWLLSNVPESEHVNVSTAMSRWPDIRQLLLALSKDIPAQAGQYFVGIQQDVN